MDPVRAGEGPTGGVEPPRGAGVGCRVSGEAYGCLRAVLVRADLGGLAGAVVVAGLFGVEP